MKKILILAVVLCSSCPVFSHELNYELDSEYADFNKELEANIQKEIQYQQQQMLDVFPSDYYIDAIKQAVEDSIRVFEDKIIFKRHYNIELLKKILREKNLEDALKNDEEVLHEIARHIVNHYPHTNDFETLMAIGIDPVEAAVRMNSEEYIQSALEKGSITYSHCYTITCANDKNNSREIIKGYIDRIAIEAKTSPEQIEEIKAKLLQQEEKRKQSKPLRKLWNSLNSNYFHW